MRTCRDGLASPGRIQSQLLLQRRRSGCPLFWEGNRKGPQGVWPQPAAPGGCRLPSHASALRVGAAPWVRASRLQLRPPQKRIPPERELWGRQRNRTVRLLPLPRPPPSLACRGGRVRPPPGAGNCGLSHMWKGRQGGVGGPATRSRELLPVANEAEEELWEADKEERPGVRPRPDAANAGVHQRKRRGGTYGYRYRTSCKEEGVHGWLGACMMWYRYVRTGWKTT